MDLRFYNQLKELMTGRFAVDAKIRAAWKREGSNTSTKIKPVFDEHEVVSIKKAYKNLKRIVHPRLALDINDLQRTNFKIKGGKVYLVDIEAIKPRVLGFGISKGFIQWFKTKRMRRAFKEGYNKVLPMNFYTKEYEAFLNLNFLLQKINYRWKIYGWKAGIKQYERNMKLLLNIVNKYTK